MSIRELRRRMSALEGKRAGRLVVHCCVRSVADMPVSAIVTGNCVDPAQRWDRLPGEPLSDLHARAAAEVGDGRSGFFPLLEVGPGSGYEKWGQLDGTH